ncbi:MAG: aminoacyl-tRNA hydrolase [Gemmataceae bacterium]|nr:aminoacyl-tRNA hydrolase [Gemmataceae bacterium]
MIPAYPYTTPVEIPADELRFTYSRSGGPGGQNVNKVATRVTLFWDFNSSATVSPAQKATLAAHPTFRTRITKDGLVVLHAQSTRSQEANRDAAIARLNELITTALIPVKTRRPTKATKGSQRRRAEAKKQRSGVKKSRGWRGDD